MTAGASTTRWTSIGPRPATRWRHEPWLTSCWRAACCSDACAARRLSTTSCVDGAVTNIGLSLIFGESGQASSGLRLPLLRSGWTGTTVRASNRNQEDLMPAYVVADLTLIDPEGFEEYRQAVPATVARYGGRYLMRGGEVVALEGEWNPSRLTVIEFPSAEQAKAWWSSEE